MQKKVLIILGVIFYYLIGIILFVHLTPDIDPCGHKAATALEVPLPFGLLMPLAWPVYFFYPPRIVGLFIPNLMGCAANI